GVEYGALQVLRAALARRHAAHDIRSILNHLLRVERSFPPCKSLHQQPCFFIDQDAHRAPPANATTFCAPSFMPSAIVKFKPLSRRISCPASTFVPSIR